nr:MAG TPA: hypothetical protein [Caudoviricetes sp.]
MIDTKYISTENIFHFYRGEIVDLERLNTHMELAKVCGQKIVMPRIYVNGREATVIDVRQLPNDAWTVRILEKGKTYYQNFYKGETLRSDGYALHPAASCQVLSGDKFWEKFHGPRGDKAPAYIFFKNHKYRMTSFARVFGTNGILVTIVSSSNTQYLIQVCDELRGEFVKFGNTWSINNGRSLEKVEVLDR